MYIVFQVNYLVHLIQLTMHGVIIGGAVAGAIILVVVIVSCFVLKLVRKLKKKSSYSTAVNTSELDAYVAFNPNPAYGAAVTPNWKNEHQYDYIPLPQDPRNAVKMTQNPAYGVAKGNDTGVQHLINSTVSVATTGPVYNTDQTPNIDISERHYDYIIDKNKFHKTQSHHEVQKTRSNAELNYLSLIED